VRLRTGGMHWTQYIDLGRLRWLFSQIEATYPDRSGASIILPTSSSLFSHEEPPPTDVVESWLQWLLQQPNLSQFYPLLAVLQIPPPILRSHQGDAALLPEGTLSDLFYECLYVNMPAATAATAATR